MDKVFFYEKDVCENCNKIFTKYCFERDGKVYNKCIKCILERSCWDDKHHKVPCVKCVINEGYCDYCTFNFCSHDRDNVECIYNNLLRKYIQFRVYPPIEKTETEELIDEFLNSPDGCVIC